MTPASNRSTSLPSEPPPVYEEEGALPPGWITEFDPNTQRHFYVDTLDEPPRAIWVHPFEDPQFQRDHHLDHGNESDGEHTDDWHEPEIITSSIREPAAAPYHADVAVAHPGDFSLDSNHAQPRAPRLRKEQQSQPNIKGGGAKERGFFGKLKDKAIGTKEERVAQRELRDEQERQAQLKYIENRKRLMAQRDVLVAQERESYNAGIGSWATNGISAGAEMYRTRYGVPGQSTSRQNYYSTAPPAMNAYGGPRYQPAYGYQYGGSPYGGHRRRRRRGGGLPLLGALAGGLLLGDALL